MKFTIFLSIVFAWNVSANVFSQVVHLGQNSKTVSVKDVLKTIEKQTDYTFFYNDAFLDLNRSVSIQKTDMEVGELLHFIFADTNLTFREHDKKFIVVTPKEFMQGITVTGAVADHSGPMPGVNITVKGTAIGVVTDINGRYQITVPNTEAVLQFSFVGYVTTEMPVGAQRVIDVNMAEDSQQIEEVVVIGYGTARKRDLTGSITRVTTEEFKTRSMSQLTEMLNGHVAGLNMNQGTSAAGGGDNLELRGATSITAGGSPMIVLDGVIFGGSIRDINPMDIVSIDIMKDASSAAIFGSNAGSGVLLITTNKGELGKKPTINVSAKIGMADDYRKLKPRGLDEYLQFKADAYRRGNSENANYNAQYVTNPDLLSGLSVANWLALRNDANSDPQREWLIRLGLNNDEMQNYFDGNTWDVYNTVFRKGLRQDYDLSINGGSSNATYFWSIGYNDYEGIRVGDRYSVLRTRLNVDFAINNWLNAGVNAQFAYRDEVPTDRNAFSPVPALDRDNYWANSPLGTPFSKDGFINKEPHGHSGSLNPLINAYRSDIFNKRYNLFSSFYASLKLPFGINYRVSFQPRFETRQWYEFFKVGREFGVPDPATVSEGRRRTYFWLNWMVDNVLSWKLDTGGHHFDVTLLANTEKNQSWNNTMYNKDFSPSQALSYHGLEFGADIPTIANSDSRSTGAAYAARLNYNFMGKYLLNATVRRDGYSAFGQDNPWAVFPAIGVGWMISEEDFFNINGIDRLKLRVSYGVNGNRNIGGTVAIATLEADKWYDGSQLQTAVFTNKLSNRGLRWEKITTFNPGFDVVLLNNRIDFSFDVYQITTTDLLLERKLSRITGFDNVMSNIGQLDNFGIDFTVKTVNVKNNDLIWSSTFIFSMNRNKLVILNDEIGTYTIQNKEQTGQLPDIPNRRFIGQGLDVVWDYNVLGIWQTAEKDEARKYRLAPGDYKVEDVERTIMNEGTANEFYALEELKDKQFIGHTQPRYRLGFQNDVRFLKNFTASVFLRAELGHIRGFGDAYFTDSQYTMRNRACAPGPYWTEENPHKEYPRINMNTTVYGGGLNIYKPSSYLRVQDVSLTYDMPREISNRIGVNNLQVFGSIRNLLTFTKYPGWDPESGGSPMPRIWTLGVNFSL